MDSRPKQLFRYFVAEHRDVGIYRSSINAIFLPVERFGLGDGFTKIF